MYYCPECQNLLGPKDDQLYCRVCKIFYRIDEKKVEPLEKGEILLTSAK